MMNLPSTHQISDIVNVYSSIEAMEQPLAEIFQAKVIGVVFYEGKVNYHLRMIKTDEIKLNVDSCLIYADKNYSQLTFEDIFSQ